jgi:hypothetical protein
MKRMWRPVLLATTLLAAPGCFFLLLMAPKTTAAALPDRPGKAVYVRRCSTCHALVEPTAYRSRLGEIVYRYRDQKIITANEQKALFEYLSPFPDARGRQLPAPTPTPTPEPSAAPESPASPPEPAPQEPGPTSDGVEAPAPEAS